MTNDMRMSLDMQIGPPGKAYARRSQTINRLMQED